MKRRLRKKRRLGEYREYGFTIVGMTESDEDALLGAFLFFAESRNVGITGTVGAKIDFFAARLCVRRRCVCCNRRYGAGRSVSPISAADRDTVLAWFAQRGIIVVAGPLIDVWHHTAADFEAATPAFPENVGR